MSLTAAVLRLARERLRYEQGRVAEGLDDFLAVGARLSGGLMFVHCCHCLNCQRQTGSAFVINPLIEADRVELLTAEPHPVEAPRDDGSIQQIYRCPACQVAVFSEYGRPGVRFVRGGTLDDPSSVAPDVHIFTRSKVPWVELPDSVPHSRSTTTRRPSGRPRASSGCAQSCRRGTQVVR